MRHQVVKTFSDYPCCHRVWNHGGKCSRLHGYDRIFAITFEADELDADTGFVVDFSDLKDVRHLLESQFDHTTIVAPDDPALPMLEQLAGLAALDLRVMDHPGMEGAARWVLMQVEELIQRKTGGRAWVAAVEARENEKNAVVVYSNRATGDGF